MELADQFINKLKNESIPELEQLPIHYYEEGITQFKLQLGISKQVALQHWKGNTDYNAMDAVHDFVSRGR
ncbi:MAG: hypothetical protein HQM14_20880 [SAR324 cluster bacterium]|nr:hypothetical protein [SAR324 cluster bacterium]